MGVYRERILPRLVDKACTSGELRRWRVRVADGLEGRVVEIGFGTGHNVPAYPSAVTEVLAVEPNELSRRLARERVAASAVPVRHVGLDGQHLSLDEDSCDGALCTFTLCTIPHPGAALAELRRVLRPGAPLHFLEHGCSPDPAVATWQRRLEPMQRRFADGCHLTRDAVELIEAAGFEVEHREQRYAKGPKPWVWMTAGRARNPICQEDRTP